MKKKEDIISSLKEIVEYNAIPDNYIIKFFNELDNEELSEKDFFYLEDLLLKKNYNVQLAILNFIKRTNNPNIIRTLVKILNNQDIKFFIKIEILLTISKFDKDNKAQNIINRMLDKLSSFQTEKKTFETNDEKILKICRYALTDFLTNQCQLKNIKISIKQVKQLIAKEKITIAANIENNIEGCFILNINNNIGCSLIEHLYNINLIKYEKIELDYYGIFYNLYIFFEELLEYLKNQFSQNNIHIEIINSNSFNFQEALLSELVDNSYLFEIQSDNFSFFIGLILHIDGEVRIKDFNNVIKNFKIEFHQNPIDFSRCFNIECLKTKLLIEYSGIKKDFQKVIMNRILLDENVFEQLKKFYDYMTREISLCPNNITYKFSKQIDFLVKTCDILDINTRNYILYKLNQINPFFSKNILNRMTFENEILKYDNDTARNIINKMTDIELAYIIHYTDENLQNFIYHNISQHRINTINQTLANINFNTLHKANIKKALDKFISFIKEYHDKEKIYINRITANI
ncbi:MAG TPA: FliG C-terminal domain-containing protein [bacterium]|nr:FliG C-terminal domain-containing protein [bacterium]HPP86551.1 FliG C-terminal domain-containing protein [bacterium]